MAIIWRKWNVYPKLLVGENAKKNHQKIYTLDGIEKAICGILHEM